MAWLTMIWARIQGWALAIFAGIAILAGTYLAGRRGGRAAAKTDALQDTIDKVRVRDDAIADNAALSDDDLRRRAKQRMHDGARK